MRTPEEHWVTLEPSSLIIVTRNLAVAMKQCYIPPIMVESTAPASKLDTQIFRDVFNASPIGIAIETLEGRCL